MSKCYKEKVFLEYWQYKFRHIQAKVGGTRGVMAAPNNTKTFTAAFNYFLFLLTILFS